MVGKFVFRVVILVVFAAGGVRAADGPARPLPPPPLNPSETGKPAGPLAAENKKPGDRKEGKGPSRGPEGEKGERRGEGTSDKKEGERGKKSNAVSDPEELPGKFRAHYESLSPGQRQHFMENWARWRTMKPREREKLMTKALEDRKRIEKLIDETLTKLDLKLDQEGREMFERRYRQERRKLEEGLRKEVDGMRKERLDRMLVDLKEEFVNGPAKTGGGKPKPAAPPERVVTDGETME